MVSCLARDLLSAVNHSDPDRSFMGPVRLAVTPKVGITKKTVRPLDRNNYGDKAGRQETDTSIGYTGTMVQCPAIPLAIVSKRNRREGL